MRTGRNSITTRCAMCAEGRKATVESSGPSGRTSGAHIDIGDDRLVRHQRHFRFAGGAGGEVKDGRIGRRLRARAAARAIRGRGSRHRGPVARSAASVMAPSASPVNRIQCSTRAPRSAANVFGSSTKTARAHRFEWCAPGRRRVAGIHGGGDGAVGENSEIGQIELQPRLGIERDHVAFGDPERV